VPRPSVKPPPPLDPIVASGAIGTGEGRPERRVHRIDDETEPRVNFSGALPLIFEDAHCD
jgi:hypothetical protein